jgi:hypothetical protein
VEQLDRAVREVRAFHLTFALCIPLYAYAAEVVPPHTLRNINSLQPAFWAGALVTFAYLAFVRRKFLQPSQEALQLRPDDARALNRWKVGSIGSSVACETIAIYGAALRFFGGTFREAAPFYACGLLLMLLFIPRSP